MTAHPSESASKLAADRKWHRAVMRREMKAGRLTLQQVLTEAQEHAVEMPLYSVLEMVPYVGYVRIAELNYEACKRGINICLPVGALTDRAKRFIIEWEQERRATSSK